VSASADTPLTAPPKSRLEILREIMEERIPFHRVLGMRLISAGGGKCTMEFAFKPELVGNFQLGILHGGVIGAALDAVGGLAVQSGFADGALFHAIGTVDMRVDFLRPGRGARFIATGNVMRPGRILSSTRMELVNETGELLAMAQAVYRVTAKDGLAMGEV
jgi:uncharacterized protein (TIGR00369 family)